MPHNRKFYLAGPFFNPAQLELQMAVETAFCDAGVPFFSPRLQKENSHKKLTEEDASIIFQRNFEEIWNCSDLIAVVDWAMPVGTFLAPIEVQDPGTQVPGLELKVGPKINIPDTGTVWELGAAYAMQKHVDSIVMLSNRRASRSGRRVWLFTQRGPDEKMNIMLTRSTDGVIYGLRQLARFLNHGTVDEGVAEKWSGGHA